MMEYPEEHDRRDDNGEHNERRKDMVARSRLEVMQEAYVHWTHRSVLLLGIICVMFLIGGLGSTYLYILVKNQQEELCQSLSERHDATLKAIDIIVSGAVVRGELKPTEAKDAIERNKKIIDAALPKKDC